MAVRRTYWHLASLGTKPTDYDIATSRLLYYPSRGFEVTTPLSAWYRDYQQGSPFQAADWDAFRDPRETTYASYVEMQRAKEAFVDGILASGRGRAPSPAWRDTLARAPVVRFPIHGLHMIAAYIGSMAPSGHIAITCAFQAADEVRRIQRFAYRIRELELADTGRHAWEHEPAWQPLREVVERLLAVRDSGESFVALVLVKTRFDELFGTRFGELARAAGDDVLANILYSLGEDASWHAAWSRELLGFATGNDAPLASWREHWQPLVSRAVEAAGEVSMIADAILDALHDGVFAVDTERRVVHWNHQMEQLTGVRRHDVVGTPVYDRFPSWREPADAEITSALAGNLGLVADFPIAAQPDRRFEATFKRLPDAAVVVILRDITQNALMREQLRETDVRFQIMADTSPVLLWMSGTDGLCNFFNQRWLEFTARTIEMELGNGWAEGVHHEDFQRCMDTYLDAFVAHRAFRMEYRLRRADGRYRWLLDTGVPRFAPSGAFAGFIGSCIDITDSKLAHDELDRLVRERTAELESFAYSVSHDLRAPLRAIDGFSHALLEDNAPQLDSAGQDHIRRVREAAQRMSSLIDDLLQLSRIGRADLASVPCDLGAITDDIVASLRERDPNRDVTVTVHRDLVVRGDPRLLRLALDNLVSNAWKFTSKTPRATIEVASIQIEGERVYVVRDNGAGFDMRYARKLFAPFQRLHGIDEFAGTGIGLATVKRIVGRHGGRVWAEAKPDEGAGFYFTLPDRLDAD